MARIYRATIRSRYATGVLVEPSFHYLTDVPLGGDEPDPDDVADGIWTKVGATYRALLNNSAHVDELVVAEEVIPPAIGAAGAKNVNAAGTGTSGPPNAPQALSPVINLHSGVRSRSGRGWLHPGWTLLSGHMASSQWEASYLGSLQAFADKLEESFDLGTLFITHVNPVIYSRTRHVRSQEPHHFAVTSATANPQVRWLRSRLSAP